MVSYNNLHLKNEWISHPYHSSIRQAECLCQGGVLLGANLVYCAPTSGGKSIVSEILGIRRLITTGLPFMVVLPFVALCSEKAVRSLSLRCLYLFYSCVSIPNCFRIIWRGSCNLSTEKSNDSTADLVTEVTYSLQPLVPLSVQLKRQMQL